MPDKIAFICVRLEERDGRYFAFSDDLPGLHLCGSSIDAVRADIGPMIEQMYLLNKHAKVRAQPAVDPQSFEAPEVSANHMRFWATPVREALAA